jgi:hypothetical protein
MKQTKFEDVQEELLKKIREKLDKNPIPNETDGFTIVGGFSYMPIHNNISGNIVIGGPTLPIVLLVGNSTGIVYTFALKVIMPELWENN